MSNHRHCHCDRTLQHLLSALLWWYPAQSEPSRGGRRRARGRIGHQYFLYQVMPNAAYRNADLPTRRANGQLVQRRKRL